MRIVQHFVFFGRGVSIFKSMWWCWWWWWWCWFANYDLHMISPPKGNKWTHVYKCPKKWNSGTVSAVFGWPNACDDRVGPPESRSMLERARWHENWLLVFVDCVFTPSCMHLTSCQHQNQAKRFWLRRRSNVALHVKPYLHGWMASITAHQNDVPPTEWIHVVERCCTRHSWLRLGTQVR